VFPTIKLTLEAYVEGETNIVLGDVLTIKVSVVRENLGENEEAGTVHSNEFPFLKSEGWYLILCEPESEALIAAEKFVMKEKESEKTFRMQASRPGNFKVQAQLISDSYKGLDAEYKLEYTVQKDDPSRVEVKYDEEDLQAKKSGGLMQSLMEAGNEEDSSDDDEEEDEPEEKKK